MNSSTVASYKLPPIESSATPKKTEDGPVYTVKNTKHVLPPPKALRPHVDSKAGELDTWPAHAGSHGTTHVCLTTNKRLVIVSNAKDDNSKPPKPRFLHQLETFLNKELTALNASTVEPSEVRLQAHREVFEYLIEDFRSYRPLLSSIKNEYEMMLSSQRQKIHELEPLKQILVTVSEQCDRKIMALRDSEKESVNDLKKANSVLCQKIASLNNEGRDLQEQVVRLQEELGVQYDKYRSECDARKLLIADMNNLRYQQKDQILSQDSLDDLVEEQPDDPITIIMDPHIVIYQQEDHILSQDSMDDLVEEQQDDPITLKIALKQARLDEKKASERLNDMVANYSDVIPRRDHEMMEAKYTVLEAKYTEIQESHENIQMEYNTLLDLQGRMKEERDKYYLEAEELKRSATPRPEWEKCGEYIEGGQEKWATMMKGKTSGEIVDVLLKEVAQGGVSGGGVQFFDGRGLEEDVPLYLRCEGPIKNRHLNKRDCLLVVMDVWREKVAKESAQSVRKHTF